MLSEIIQTQKYKYCIIPLMCGTQHSQTLRNFVKFLRESRWWLPGDREIKKIMRGCSRDREF